MSDTDEKVYYLTFKATPDRAQEIGKAFNEAMRVLIGIEDCFEVKCNEYTVHLHPSETDAREIASQIHSAIRDRPSMS